MFEKKNSDNEKQLLSDLELIREIQNGNRDLLKILYNRYAQKIFRKCYSLVKNKEEAKDLAHDVIIKVMTKLNSFKGNSEFSLWVHSVTYNHCINYLKKSKRIIFQDEESVGEISDEADGVIEEKILLEIKLEQLENLMNELKPEERIVLVMHYKEQMKVKKIAVLLDISESAVKMRLKRSREKLYKLFQAL